MIEGRPHEVLLPVGTYWLCRFIRVGRLIRYSRAALDEWLAARTVGIDKRAAVKPDRPDPRGLLRSPLES